VQAAAQTTEKPVQISLPAGNLADALERLGDQSGVQIMYEPALAKGVKVAAVSGTLTVTDTLRQLLARTGLQADRVNDKTVVLKRAEAKKNPIKKQDQTTLEQTPQESPLAEVDVVVVTAQKKTENLMEVPVPVSTVAGQTLLDNSELRVQDFYSTLPGVSYSPTGSQSEEALAIRGITTGPGNNPTTGVTVDGVPFGSSLNQGTGNDIPDIDPNDLARVEVLRGPQGTLYGSSSMGGLLNFVTKEPSTSGFSGNASAGINGVHNGAQAGYNFRASANIPLTSDFALRASGFTRQDPGFINDPVQHIEGINEEHASGGHLSALWKPSSSLSLKLSALYQDIKADGSSDVNRGPGYANGLGDLQQNYYPGIDGFRGLGGYERQVQAYSAVFSADLGRVNLISITGYTVNAYRDTWDFTPQFGAVTAQQPEFGGVSGTPIDDHLTTRRINQELRLSGTVLGNVDWLIGAFYDHEHTTYLENIYAESLAGQVVGIWANWTLPTTYQEYAGFGDLTYRFTDKFDLQVGGRESHIDVTNNAATQVGPFETLVGAATYVPQIETAADVFTYLLTPRFKISPDLMVYARFASGYRPGTPNGAVYPGLPAQSDPDKAYNYEMGLKGDFLDHKLTVDGSLYYVDWKNIQTFVVDPKTQFGYRGNSGNAKSAGIELTVTSRPWTGLTISAWMDYDDAVLTQGFPLGSTGYGIPGTRLPFSPKWSGFTSIQQDFPLATNLSGFVGAQASFVGNRFGQFSSSASAYRQYYPGYTQINLRTGVVRSSWTGNLYITNVADNRAVIGGGTGSFPPNGFQYIQPRTVGLNVTKSF